MDGRRMVPESAVVYPSRDGRPMGETDDHRDELKDWMLNVLRDRFAGEPMVYVSGNNFVYFVEGDTKECVSPDVYVVKGVPNRQRDNYQAWKEGGRLPCFVLEITSKSTRREDLGEKMAKYRDDLGVKEYFLFDPHREWVVDQLRGYALQGDMYQSINPNAAGRLPSGELGLELAVVGGHVRFFAPGDSAPLPTREERAEQEHQRAEQEHQRAEQERQRAEQEHQRAEQEHQRAEQERQRAELAEQEALQLRTELERLRRERGTA